jgi:polysaccharide biosynthesis/export protein
LLTVTQAVRNDEVKPVRIFQAGGRSLLASALLVVAAWGSAYPQGDSITAKRVAPVLQPGDLVRLKIWREPDLSGDYLVDEDGLAVFPKIGRLPVASLATDSLKRLLVTSYSRYLQDPSVEVAFLRRVSVIGEVRSPGLYHADPTMTVADVLALAGGATSQGNPKKIELLRQGERVPVVLLQETPVSDLPIRSGDQLRVPERSWLSRNTTLIAAGITAVALVFAAVIDN